MADIQAAFVDRSIRSIKNELEFLHAAGRLSAEAAHAIVTSLGQFMSMDGSVPASSARQSATAAGSTENGLPGYSHSPAASPDAFPDEKKALAHTPANRDTGRIETVVAVYDYNSSDAGDLQFLKDDRVAVKKHENAEWSFGRNERTGMEGIFPRNYVRVLDQHTSENTDSGTSSGGIGGETGKKFGKKLGNAAIFGAGATIGSNIVNSIF